VWRHLLVCFMCVETLPSQGSVLQQAAVGCQSLPCVAMCCNTLHVAAVCCSVVAVLSQCVAVLLHTRQDECSAPLHHQGVCAIARARAHTQKAHAQPYKHVRTCVQARLCVQRGLTTTKNRGGAATCHGGSRVCVCRWRGRSLAARLQQRAGRWRSWRAAPPFEAHWVTAPLLPLLRLFVHVCVCEGEGWGGGTYMESVSRVTMDREREKRQERDREGESK